MFSGLLWWSRLLIITLTAVNGSRKTLSKERFVSREQLRNTSSESEVKEPTWMKDNFVPSLSFCTDKVNKNCIIASDRKVNWSEAHSFCRSRGGFLLDDKELKRLQSLQVVENLTWSALVYFSGTYQWLNEKPSVARFIEWERNYTPSPWDRRCPLFNIVSAKYLLANCSEEYHIACIISEDNLTDRSRPRNIELRIVSNMADEDGWINVSKDHFHELVLSCSVHKLDSGTKMPNDVKVHWSKDGIWMNNHQPTIHPATTYDSYKSSWLPLNETSEFMEAVKQGTFCCEYWIPFTTILTRNNCFLVTLKEWTTLVVTLKLKENYPLDSDSNTELTMKFVRNITDSLFQDSFPNIVTFPRAPISFSKFSDSLVFWQSVKANYEIKFHIYIKNLSQEDDDSLKSIAERLTNHVRNLPNHLLTRFSSTESDVKFATYCNAFSVSEKYGNFVDYPFARAGQSFNSKYKCEVGNNTLIYPVCRWNYTNGAEISSALNCSRLDLCPRGFSVIKETVCVKVLSNVSWEEGFKNFYKLGSEFTLFEKGYNYSEGNDSLHHHVIDYLLDSKIQSVWLLLKRRYDKTLLTNFTKLLESSSFSYIQPNGSTNYKWRKGHPKADKRCVALKLQGKEYYSLECDNKNNFVILIDTDNMFPRNTYHSIKDAIYDRNNENKSFDGYYNYNRNYILNNNKRLSSICKSRWIEMPTLKGTNVCVKQFFPKQELTWEVANTFCSSKDASLPSLQLGFRNWFYSNFSNLSHSVYWINIKIEKHLDTLEFDYVNWLPSTNFSNMYGVMNGNGWFLADESETQNSVICERKTLKTKFPELFLEKSLSHKNVLCINIYNVNSYSPVKCFENGVQILNIISGREGCPLAIDVRKQGYYECEMWSDATNKRIESNSYLYRNESVNAFVVMGYELKKMYNPLIHDSTFLTSQEHKSTCINDIYQYILGEEEWMDIGEILFSEKDGVFQYSFVFKCQQASASFCTSEKAVLANLNKILNDSASRNHCLIQEVRSTIGCLQEITKDKFHNDSTITWPNTAGRGKIVPKGLCVGENGQLVSRTCDGSFINGYFWQRAPEGCPESPSNRAVNIWKISQDPTGYSKGKYKRLPELTKESRSLLPVDVYYVTSAFQALSKDSDSSKLVRFEEIVETMNNVMSVTNNTFSAIYETSNSSSVLLDSFEKLAFSSEEEENMIKLKKYAFKDKIVSECTDISNSLSIRGYQLNQFRGSLLTENQSVSTDAEVAIILPETLVETVVKSHKSERHFSEKKQILFAVYKTDLLFYDPESISLGFKVNSQIIQAAYEKLTIINLKNRVKILFRPKSKTSELKCVFWDFRKNKRKGGWSERGCHLTKRDEKCVICECNHLTTFSLLIRYSNIDKYIESHKKILQLISIIGCGLSGIGLTMVLTTFVIFRKWRKSLSNQILANLSLAILGSLLIFVVGIEQTWNAIICRSVAIALHYFILVSFGWMLVEGVHQYLKFVKVVGTYIPRFLWKAAICAWGLPILPIAITSIIDIKLYNDGINSDICWMGQELFLYGFVPLVSLVLFINAVLFALIIDNVVIRRKAITSTLKNRDIMKTQLTMAICVFILLGFTWIFGFLAISDGAVVFSYLFCIFNTLQGFGIFIFHLCRDRPARRLWKNLVHTLSASSGDRSTTGSFHPGAEMTTTLSRK